MTERLKNFVEAIAALVALVVTFGGVAIGLGHLRDAGQARRLELPDGWHIARDVDQALIAILVATLVVVAWIGLTWIRIVLRVPVPADVEKPTTDEEKAVSDVSKIRSRSQIVLAILPAAAGILSVAAQLAAPSMSVYVTVSLVAAIAAALLVAGYRHIKKREKVALASLPTLTFEDKVGLAFGAVLTIFAAATAVFYEGYATGDSFVTGFSLETEDDCVTQMHLPKDSCKDEGFEDILVLASDDDKLLLGAVTDGDLTQIWIRKNEGYRATNSL